jgi:hypothetical protein
MAKPEAPKISADRKKLYVLGGLVAFLVLVVAWNLSGSKPKPAPPPTAADGRVRNSELGKPRSDQSGAPEAGSVRVADEQTFGPIEVLPLYAKAGGGDVIPARNIFDYPPPPPRVIPPLPPKETPPPPTINLGSVSPGQAIAGTSKPIQISLSGSIFPSDSQVYFNGQPVESQRLSATAIRATIPPSFIGSPGAIAIQVKSASQPDRLWSGTVNFQLTPSPDPNETFVYSGRVGSQAVLSFKDTSRKPKVVSTGDVVNGAVPWKILAINDRQIELLDTRNEIRKTLGLAAKAR